MRVCIYVCVCVRVCVLKDDGSLGGESKTGQELPSRQNTDTDPVPDTHTHLLPKETD